MKNYLAVLRIINIPNNIHKALVKTKQVINR